MKKKVLAALMCAAMTVGMLAGCGGNSTAGNTSADAGEAASGTESADSGAGRREMDVEGDDVTTLEVWTFIENHQDFYTNMAEKWNEENPDKKVKLVLSNMAYDDMHNKLSLALESGEGAPDVVDIELGKFPAFMTGDIGLKPLNDAVEPYLDNVVESRLQLYSKDGNYYGFPTHVGTTVAFYNTEALEAAGIDYTTIKTWDDFSGDVAAAIMPFWQTSRYLSYMTDLSGKVAIAAPPVFGDNDAVKTIGGGGTGTAVVASSPNADLAAEVFAYIKLSDTANVEVWNVLGFDPVNTAVWTDKSVTENPDNQYVQYFNTKPFDALLDVQDGIGLLTCYIDEKMPSINNIFCTETLNNIFESGMDVKEALDEAQSALQNEFGE